LQNKNADLQVKVMEESGEERVSIVPASLLLLAESGGYDKGWNFAGGRYWDQTGLGIFREASVATASHGWAYKNVSGVSGALVSPDYTSLGLAFRSRFTDRSKSVFGQLLGSRESFSGHYGLQGSSAFNLRLGSELRVGVSGNLRTAHYQGLQQSLANIRPLSWEYSGYRSQVGADLNWQSAILGGFSAAITQENYRFGSPGHVLSFSWGKSLADGASLNVGLFRRTARLSPIDVLDIQAGDRRTPSSNYIFATLSIPIGKGTVSRTYLSRGDGTQRVSTGVDQRINDQLGYSATVENAEGPFGSGRGGSMSVYATPYYTHLSAGVSRVRKFENTYLEAGGGVVATGDGIAFSPYPIQDTFGIIRTGNVMGARIDTPQGTVWSGPGGLAAVPGLSPFQRSRIELRGDSIPIDVDVANGVQSVQTFRGAVVSLDFGMMAVRRNMVNISLANGSALPAGTALIRDGGEFVTTSSEGGLALITELTDHDIFNAELPGGAHCVVRRIEPAKRKPGDLFGRARARCL
jgi:outer membrane usher protein FimD/PapC